MTSRSSVFALVTPMSVRELLALGIIQTLGKHAPADKRERDIASTVAGLGSGRFALDIDGKLYSDPEAYVACNGTVTLRFFLIPQHVGGR